MPKSTALYTCKFCGQPHVSRLECLEHEAECLWDKRGHLYDSQVHGCLSCGRLERRDGMFCSGKKGALITVPVSICGLWTPIPAPTPAPAPAGQAQAQGVA